MRRYRSDTMPRALPAVSLCAVLSCATWGAAQVAYDPVIGAPLAAGNDTISAVSLPFSFTFPDGSVVSALDIDSNGRILPPGADVSEFLPSVAELLGGAPALLPFWLDLDFTLPAAGDIYFDADATRAVVTFRDAVRWGGVGSPFTFQAQIFADGRVGFVYDDRCPRDLPIIGVTPGGGAPDPGTVDWSAGPVASAGVPVLYEDFFGAVGGFDLQDMAAECAPDGGGGWNVSVGPSLRARSKEIGPAGRVAVRWTPRATGGYDLVRLAGGDGYFSGYGQSLGLVRDDEMSTPIPLAFSFAMPGGSAATAIEVDSNGRLVLPARVLSDHSASVSEFLSDPTPSIAPLWTDLDLSAPQSQGDVWFDAQPDRLTVTWERVLQYEGRAPLTFQVTLHDDDAITMVYVDAATWSAAASATGAATALVGVSPGSGAMDLGPFAFADLPTAAPGTQQASYVFFDGAAGGRFDAQPAMRATSRPELGGTLDLVVAGVPRQATAATVLLGFQNPRIDFDAVPAVGLPGCTLLTDAIATVPAPLIAGSSESSVVSFAVPQHAPTLVGLTLYAQPALTQPGATPLGLVLGGAVAATIGF